MITPNVETLKDDIDREMQVAFDKFCTSYLKKEKAEVHKAQEIAVERKRIADKRQKDYNSITGGDLRELFFKYDVIRQSSPYEKALKDVD